VLPNRRTLRSLIVCGPSLRQPASHGVESGWRGLVPSAGLQLAAVCCMRETGSSLLAQARANQSSRNHHIVSLGSRLPCNCQPCVWPSRSGCFQSAAPLASDRQEPQAASFWAREAAFAGPRAPGEGEPSRGAFFTSGRYIASLAYIVPCGSGLGRQFGSRWSFHRPGRAHIYPVSCRALPEIACRCASSATKVNPLSFRALCFETSEPLAKLRSHGDGDVLLTSGHGSELAWSRQLRHRYAFPSFPTR
jgi:hypothetical protein